MSIIGKKIAVINSDNKSTKIGEVLDKLEGDNYLVNMYNIIDDSYDVWTVLATKITKIFSSDNDYNETKLNLFKNYHVNKTNIKYDEITFNATKILSRCEKLGIESEQLIKLFYVVSGHTISDNERNQEYNESLKNGDILVKDFLKYIGLMSKYDIKFTSEFGESLRVIYHNQIQTNIKRMLYERCLELNLDYDKVIKLYDIFSQICSDDSDAIGDLEPHQTDILKGVIDESNVDNIHIEFNNFGLNNYIK